MNIKKIFEFLAISLISGLIYLFTEKYIVSHINRDIHWMLLDLYIIIIFGVLFFGIHVVIQFYKHKKLEQEMNLSGTKNQKGEKLC